MDTSVVSSQEKFAKKVEDPSDWLGLKADTDFDQNETEKYALPTPKTPHLLSKTNNRDGDFHSSTLDTKDNLRENSESDVVSRKHPTPSILDGIPPKVNIPSQRRGGTQESRNKSSILSSFISDFGMFSHMLSFYQASTQQWH